MPHKSQNQKVWDYLQSHDYITAFEMFEKFNICHPPARIRDLRKKYGYSTILDREVMKKRVEKDEQGKEHTITVRYKQYFLNKMSGVA